MHDTDKDIEELRSLFGAAVSDYRSLEPARPLDQRPPQASRSRGIRTAAIAASLIVGLAVATLAVLDGAEPRDSRPASQITIATSFPDPPLSRPGVADIRRPDVALSRLALRMSLPRNPARSGG